MAQSGSSLEYVGLRVPGPVKRLWVEKAKQERRSLSNWILHKLEDEQYPSGKKRHVSSN